MLAALTVLADVADRLVALQIGLSGDDEAVLRIVCKQMDQDGGLLALLACPTVDEELLAILADAVDLADDLPDTLRGGQRAGARSR